MPDSGTVHFGFAVAVLRYRDLPRAIAFYTEKMGFELSFSMGDPVHYAGVGRGHCGVHLAASDLPPQSNAGGWAGRGHPADVNFFVKGIDALYTEYTARGVDVAGPPTLQTYGIRDIDVRDPEGYVLRFNEVVESEA